MKKNLIVLSIIVMTAFSSCSELLNNSTGYIKKY